MSLTELLSIAANKENFRSLTDYIKFCRRYLDFLTDGIQAEIVSQNESNYRFFQYREDGNFNITRPVNANLMYTVENGAVIEEGFLRVLRAAREVATADDLHDPTINWGNTGCFTSRAIKYRKKNQRRLV